MTNKEINTAIKKELKDAGYRTRDFSVSVKDCGYSTSIRITIKNPEINRKTVERLLLHWESVDRDLVTGEILGGANTYLFIRYADGIFTEVSQEWATTACGVFSSNDEVVMIFDGLYFINKDRKNHFEIRQQDKREHCTLQCNDFLELCVFIYKFAKFGSIAI